MLVFCCIGVDDLTLGAVDLDTRGARGGEESGGGDGEGEDVGRVSVGDGVSLEILFGLHFMSAHARSGWRSEFYHGSCELSARIHRC